MTNHSIPFLLSVLVTLWLMPATAALVEPDLYLAGEHTSEWRFQGSKVKCELSHVIPQFGAGRFLRLAGEDLIFQISSYQPVPTKVDGLMREISPTWKHERPDALKASIDLQKGLMPVNLKRKKAAWLLASLAKGQMPSFEFLDWNDTRKQVLLRLSPVNYQKPYREFKRCLKQISDKGFDAYREMEVYFDLDIHVLSTEEQNRLKSLIDYILADSSIRSIQIEGHADDQGTRKYNQKLSMRRVENVVKYLLSAGVEPDKLETHAYGETRPKIRSRSDQARAINRRAEIRLER